MNKHMQQFVLRLLLCAVCLPAMAQHVSEQVALERAQSFLQAPASSASPKGMRKAPRKAPRLKAAVTREEFYIFNDEANQGFVIVSGEERTPDILGYSDEGCFDSSNIPDNVKAWLDGYAEQIQAIAASPSKAEEEVDFSREPIAPLMKTKWGQDWPYKKITPIANDGYHCVTGCVATAMAQIMYFYKHPQETAKDIPIPTCVSNQTCTYTGDSIPAGSKIDWDNIIPLYKDYRGMGSFTEIQEDAVSQLMLDCGFSVNMSYGRYGSSAYSSAVGTALINYFDYAVGCRLIHRDSREYADWLYLLYNELRHGRPIYYDGINESSIVGHAFVCDGYANEDYFHINWGWDGDYDGFYRIAVLKPGCSNYSLASSALFGVQPTGQFSIATPLAVKEILINKETYTRSATSSNFTGVSITPRLFMTTIDNYAEYAIALEKDGQVISILSSGSYTLQIGDIRETSVSLSFGANLSNGVYQLVPVCRKRGETTWQHDIDADQTFVDATINSKNLTLALHQPSLPESNLACVKTPFVTGSYSIFDENVVTYRIRNYSTINDFSGKLTLCIQRGKNEPVATLPVDINVGQTIDVRIPFTPQLVSLDEGTYSFALFSDKVKLEGSDFKMTFLPRLKVDLEFQGEKEDITNYHNSNPNSSEKLLWYKGDYIEGTLTLTYPMVEGYATTIKDSLLLFFGESYIVPLNCEEAWFGGKEKYRYIREEIKRIAIDLKPGDSVQIPFSMEYNPSKNGAFFMVEQLHDNLPDKERRAYVFARVTSERIVIGPDDPRDKIILLPKCDPADAGFITGSKCLYEEGEVVTLTAHAYSDSDYRFGIWEVVDENGHFWNDSTLTFTATKDYRIPNAIFWKKTILSVVDTPTLSDDIPVGGSGEVSITLRNNLKGEDFSGYLRLCLYHYYGKQDTWEDTVSVYVDIQAKETKTITFTVNHKNCGVNHVKNELNCKLEMSETNTLVEHGNFNLFLHPGVTGIFTVLNADSRNRIYDDELRFHLRLERLKNSTPMKGTVDIYLNWSYTSSTGHIPLDVDFSETDFTEKELVFHRGNSYWGGNNKDYKLSLGFGGSGYSVEPNASEQTTYHLARTFGAEIDHVVLDARNDEGFVGFKEDKVTTARAVEYFPKKGEVLHVYAQPKEGYKFVGWYNRDPEGFGYMQSNVFLSSDMHYAFEVEKETWLWAVFVAENTNPYEVTVSADPEEGGTVTGSGTFARGMAAHLTATPASGYEFVNWTTKTSTTALSTDLVYKPTINSNRNFVAHFKKITYDITATTNPTNGGTVSGAGTYEKGASVTLTATPAEGYTFVNWTENGTVVSTNDVYSFSATQERNLVANFELLTTNPVVTYKVRLNNKVIATAQVEVTAGAALPELPASLSNDFLMLTKSGTHPATVTKNVTVYYDATWNGPFQFTSSLSDATWYVMSIRNGYYIAKQESEPYKPAKVDDVTLINPEYHWAFGGDPYHVKVYNKTTGLGETLAVDGSNIVMRSGDYSWDILSNGKGFNLRIPETTNSCVFHYVGSRGLTFWADDATFTHSASRLNLTLVSDVEDGIHNVMSDATPVAIYTTSGTMVGTNIEALDELPTGIYIFRLRDGSTKKVVIK